MSDRGYKVFLLSCSYLCFESSSSRSASSKKNKVIKLQDITDIQKVCTMYNAFYYFVIFVLISGKLFILTYLTCVFILYQYKVLSVLPGSGMGISIATPSTQKVRSKLFALGYNSYVYTRLVPIIPFSMCVHAYFVLYDLSASGVWCHDSPRRSLWGHLQPVHKDHRCHSPCHSDKLRNVEHVVEFCWSSSFTRRLLLRSSFFHFSVPLWRGAGIQKKRNLKTRNPCPVQVPVLRF